MRNNGSEIFHTYADVQLVFDGKVLKVHGINRYRRLKRLFQCFCFQSSSEADRNTLDPNHTFAFHNHFCVACKGNPTVLRVYVQLLRSKAEVLHKVS